MGLGRRTGKYDNISFIIKTTSVLNEERNFIHYFFFFFFFFFQDKRKEAFKSRKERLDVEQSEREKVFLEKLHEAHEVSLALNFICISHSECSFHRNKTDSLHLADIYLYLYLQGFLI